MKYNFDELTNRFNQDSLKWNVKNDELPMWVADMDFKTAPCIIDALKKRVEVGIFGYNDVSDDWYNAYIDYWKERHNFTIKKEWLMFCTGVVPAISSIVRKITTVGENVLLLTPVYNIFYNSILNNGRHVLESNLIYDDNKYSVDFTDLEEKLKNPQTSLMILCNPHNPIGKIWDRDTLEKIGNLCHKYNVVVLSDEIHCDLVDPNKQYIPFAAVNNINRDISITCISVTKAFNLAGLQTSAIVVPNKYLFQKVNRGINTDEVAEPNSFAQVCAISALKEGKDYLDALRNYLYENKLLVREAFKDFYKVVVIESEATYLLWIDITSLNVDAKEFVDFVREKTRLYLSYGNQFGGNGNHFIRMNIATQKERVIDGINRLKKAIKLFNS